MSTLVDRYTISKYYKWLLCKIIELYFDCLIVEHNHAFVHWKLLPQYTDDEGNWRQTADEHVGILFEETRKKTLNRQKQHSITNFVQNRMYVKKIKNKISSNEAVPK